MEKGREKEREHGLTFQDCIETDTDFTSGAAVIFKPAVAMVSLYERLTCSILFHISSLNTA